jgi:DNA-binding LytR/AlgR family response regulator
MKYVIGICDDNYEQILLIKQYLNNFPWKGELTIIESTQADKFLSLLQENKPDFVFLDIDMGEVNGIELGKKIRKVFKNMVIIYVTGHENYAIEAFQVRAFHYLLKPIVISTFNEVVSETIEFLGKMNSKNIQKNFIVKTKKEIISIDYNDIYYFEKINRKIKIHSKSRDILYYDNFSNLSNEIDSDDFLRCHQGYIVNIDKIKSLRNRTLFLYGDYELPVSRSYSENVREMFTKKLFDRGESK